MAGLSQTVAAESGVGLDDARLLAKRKRRLDYEKNREKQLAQGAVWKANNRDRTRGYYRTQDLKKNYGITVEQWNEMFSSQGGKCAACGSSNPGARNWSTDHCHTTDKIRGILCMGCNLAVGHGKNSPHMLRQMAAYLERHNASAN